MVKGHIFVQNTPKMAFGKSGEWLQKIFILLIESAYDIHRSASEHE